MILFIIKSVFLLSGGVKLLQILYMVFMGTISVNEKLIIYYV